MRNKLFCFGLIVGLVGCSSNTSPNNSPTPPKSDDPNQPLDISLRNIYFGNYQARYENVNEDYKDIYLSEVEEKFNVKLELSAYSYTQWDEQVANQVKGDTLPDVFHANIDSFNFGTTYKKWAENDVLKPLPDDLSKWPNIQDLVQNASNIEYLKINNKLYGIPIVFDTSDYSKTFSSHTYVYRRDWAKNCNVYQENDEYTWEQFMALIKAFSPTTETDTIYPISDPEWNLYPSVVNFFKKAPYCYAQDDNGNHINNFTTDEFITGLKASKNIDVRRKDLSKSGGAGIIYDNFTYSNYSYLFKRNNNYAFLKVRAPESFYDEDTHRVYTNDLHANKFVLDGSENWWSMTLFSHRMNNKKQEKILDIMDWLLSEEGTRYAVYGKENLDYKVVDGNIELIDRGWQKEGKDNVVKFLRYLVSFGNDTLEYDPLTDKDSYTAVKTWENEMKQALEDNELDIIRENPEVAYLTTENKTKYTNKLRDDAGKLILKYSNETDYKAGFDNTLWDRVLSEINNALK